MNEDDITEKIIGCAYSVARELGFGFLEKVYENAMIIELSEKKLQVENQKSINVFYHGKNVGQYYADLIVENRVIVELKSIKELNSVHKAQLLNYLKATKHRIGLLINFAPEKVEIKRVINGY